MELLGGVIVLQALKTVGAAVLWALSVLVLWRAARALKYANRILAIARACEKCGKRQVNPDARFCRDCGGKLLKAA
jgi:uncharacterized OB-fold protein